MQVPPALEDASKSGSVQDLIDAVVEDSRRDLVEVQLDFGGQRRPGRRPHPRARPDSQDPPRFEQWIQIAIVEQHRQAGPERGLPGAPAGHGRGVPDQRGHRGGFRGYSRTAKGFVPEGRGTISDLSKCYSCHPSGLRPVIPATVGSIAAGGDKAIKPEGTMLGGPDLAHQLENLKEQHERVRPGSGRWDTSFGERSATRTVEPVRPAPNSWPPAAPKAFPTTGAKRSWTAWTVSSATTGRIERPGHAGHPECRHEPRDDLSQGREEHGGPDASGVNDPGGLTAAEREILFKCLRAEYAEILREWLTGTS